MNFQFYRRDIAASGLDVASFIRQNSDIDSQIEKFKNFPTKLNRKTVTATDLTRLADDVRAKFEEFGWFGFSRGNFSDANLEDRIDFYGGLGITYNPFHWQQIENKHVHVLGDRRFNLGTIFLGRRGGQLWDRLILSDRKNEFYRIAESQGLQAACQFLVSLGLMEDSDIQTSPPAPEAARQRLANTYSDTLSFNRLTPASQSGYLGNLLHTVPRTIVRSRLVELKSEQNAEVHWHVDEDIFICTRINLPIWSDLNQKLVTEGGEAEFQVGSYYSWDTGKPHKVVVEGTGSRTNLVLGLSPWFDYDHESELWSSNEFYGEAHPHELFEKDLLVRF